VQIFPGSDVFGIRQRPVKPIPYIDRQSLKLSIFIVKFSNIAVSFLGSERPGRHVDKYLKRNKMTMKGFGFHVTGQFAVIGAGFLYACSAIYVRRFKGNSPVVVSEGMLSASAIMMVPFVLIIEQP
jgi:drug/metabolite transporter (DMT)-like permease